MEDTPRSTVGRAAEVPRKRSVSDMGLQYTDRVEPAATAAPEPARRARHSYRYVSKKPSPSPSIGLPPRRPLRRALPFIWMK